MTAAYWDEAKAHLSKRDKVLKKIIAEYEGEFLTTKNDPFYTLARAIVGQQISVKAADSVWKKLTTAIRKMTPASVLKKPDDELRACGLSSQKVKYLRALAEYFSTPRDFSAMGDHELLASLTSINGVGSWTAEMFMIFHLARPDVFPIKDIGVQKAMFRHYHNSEKVPLAELIERAEGWRPYRSVATWYLWRSLDPVPVAY
jgi:DNA-3-methyladenine glycosylase II